MFGRLQAMVDVITNQSHGYMDMQLNRISGEDDSSPLLCAMGVVVETYHIQVVQFHSGVYNTLCGMLSRG